MSNCTNPKCKNPDCTCGENCKCDETHQCSEKCDCQEKQTDGAKKSCCCHDCDC